MYIPGKAFEGFLNLDSFTLEHGTIDDVEPNAMSGLDVKPARADLHKIPRKYGRFEMRYSRLVNKVIPPGLLYSWKYLKHAAVVV